MKWPLMGQSKPRITNPDAMLSVVSCRSNGPPFRKTLACLCSVDLTTNAFMVLPTTYFKVERFTVMEETVLDLVRDLRQTS